MATLFLSYSSRTRPEADRLERDLRAEVLEIAWLGDVEEQENRMDDFLERHPDFALVHHVRGLMQRLRGDFRRSLRSYERCLALFDRALEVNPGYTGARMNRATLLAEHLGRPDEARRELEQVLALDDEYADAHQNYAVLLKLYFHEIPLALEHAGRAQALRARLGDGDRGWPAAGSAARSQGEGGAGKG